MIMTLVVAVNNMTVNVILRLFGDRRKTVLLSGVLCSVIGILLACSGFKAADGKFLFILSLLLIAFPSGYFPIFGTIARELCPAKYTGMAVAYLNFMAFVFISLYQNINGIILSKFHPQEGTLAFSTDAYSAVYLFFLIGGIISLAAACFVPETKGTEIK